MDLHKPKPWHNIREFLKEYLIIVIGVLTALGAEQAVEAVHERGLAREAKAAIDAEMQDNVNRAAYRQAQQPCIDARLRELTGLLAGWAGGKPPPAGLSLGDPGDMPLVLTRWQANLNNGRFSQQSIQAQGAQSSIYVQLAVLADIEQREHYAWSELRALELGPGVLTADLRPELVAALQAARTDASDAHQLGQDVLRTARRSGFTPQAIKPTAIVGSTCGPLIPAR